MRSHQWHYKIIIIIIIRKKKIKKTRFYSDPNDRGVPTHEVTPKVLFFLKKKKKKEEEIRK